VQSSDIRAFQNYTLKNKESWQYYLFLLRENPKIYLDYIRTMQTLEKIYCKKTFSKVTQQME